MMETIPLVQQRQRTLVRYARPRRLGSLFIPLRRSYLFIMPMALFGAAIFCWSNGTDFSMIVGAVILSAVSLYLLFDLLGRRAPLRVSTVLAITLGLAYGLGTANTWFTLPRGDETLGEFLHISPPDLAHAMGTVLTVVALLLSLGELLEKPIFGEEFELRFNNRAIIFLTLGAIELGISFAHGSTGFMGGSASQEGSNLGRVGILASVSEWLSGSLLALAVCVSLNVKGIFLRNYARLLSVLLFIMVFPLGRRVLIYACLLTLIGLRLGRYKFPFSPLKKTLLLGLLAGVIYMVTIGFFFLRLAGYTLIRPSLVQRVEAAIRLAREKSYTDVKKEFSENVQKRTFILGFLGQLEGYTDSMEGARGDDIVGQFKLALPSVLYPEKDVFFSEEHLANSLFGSNYTDEANSVLTTGAVDFGLWGMLIYPLLMVVMIRTLFEFVAEAMPVFASCFVILASFSTLLEPEVMVSTYFLIIRNSLFFGSFVWFIMSLPEFRVKNVGL